MRGFGSYEDNRPEKVLLAFNSVALILFVEGCEVLPEFSDFFGLP